MSTFRLYLQLGFEHISDLNAYDHILFLVALCAIYRIVHWKIVLILVTAFTIGHSIALAAAALELVNIRTDIIEFLIPVTILITCIYNVFNNEVLLEKKNLIAKYAIALVFGLIHGLGFSNYLKETIGALMKGNFDIVKPLMGFNVGLELGQIAIVFVILMVSYLMLNIIAIKEKHWNYLISSLAGIISIYLMTQTKFW